MFYKPFSSASVFNTPIPPSPTIDTNSANMVALLATGIPGHHYSFGVTHNIAWYAFGIPVYHADSTTPRVTTIARGFWNEPLFQGSMPIPTGAQPNTGSDAHLVVIDMSARRVYDCWQYNPTKQTCGYGRIALLDGTGAGPNGTTGAKVPMVAGVIRVRDIRVGVINHALSFLTPFTMSGVTNFRYPATTCDGTYAGMGAIPEGARVQLDPSINVDEIANMTPMEKMVGHALQTYGAFAVDTGAPWNGSNPSFITFYGELPTGADARNNPWPAVYGPDWANMPDIPWNRLRVVLP
jgi:hypothetical protein